LYKKLLEYWTRWIPELKALVDEHAHLRPGVPFEEWIPDRALSEIETALLADMSPRVIETSKIIINGVLFRTTGYESKSAGGFLKDMRTRNDVIRVEVEEDDEDGNVDIVMHTGLLQRILFHKPFNYPDCPHDVILECKWFVNYLSCPVSKVVRVVDDKLKLYHEDTFTSAYSVHPSNPVLVREKSMGTHEARGVWKKYKNCNVWAVIVTEK
jgi:hypothetical protein